MTGKPEVIVEIRPLLCSHKKRPLSYDNVETARVMAYASVFTRVMDYTGTGSSLGLRHRERERDRAEAAWTGGASLVYGRLSQ